MARHDALTGLPNRLQLLDNLGAALDGARRRAASNARSCWSISTASRRSTTASAMSPATICCSRSSRCFETVISDEMTAGRLGGDEFAIVVPARREPRRARAALPRLGQRAAGAVPLPRPAAVRRRQHRRRDRPERRRQRRGDDPQRRSRALPGQGRQRQRHPLLRAGAPRPRRGAPQDRAGAARRDGRRRVQPRLPAAGRRPDARDQELRGAAALAQSRARPDPARPSSSRSPRKPACSAGSANGCCAPPARKRRAGPSDISHRGQRLAAPAARSGLHRHPRLGADPGRARAASGSSSK